MKILKVYVGKIGWNKLKEGDNRWLSYNQKRDNEW